MKQECIVASLKSYGVNPGFQSYDREHTYRMITKCFLDNANLTLVTNCESPDADNLDVNKPVTSLLTGYIYWNMACAACNDDAVYVKEWVPNIIIKANVPYFSNSSVSQVPFPDTYEKLLTYIQSPRLSDLIYTPPAGLSTELEDKVCILKDSFVVKYCEMSPHTEALSEMDWLFESCRRFVNPVRLLDGDIYMNIFCFVCMHKMHLTSSEQRCSRGKGLVKAPKGYLTALFNYKSELDTTTSLENDMLLVEGSCGCAEIFDPFLVNILMLTINGSKKPLKVQIAKLQWGKELY